MLCKQLTLNKRTQVAPYLTQWFYYCKPVVLLLKPIGNGYKMYGCGGSHDDVQLELKSFPVYLNVIAVIVLIKIQVNYMNSNINDFERKTNVQFISEIKY